MRSLATNNENRCYVNFTWIFSLLQTGVIRRILCVCITSKHSLCSLWIITFRVLPEQCIYYAFSHASYIPKMFLLTTSGWLLTDSWICHLSHILAWGVGISVHQPVVHSTTGGEWSMGTCLMSSFMLIHIQANKHYPSSPSLPSKLNSFFLLEVFL